jgi:hypothetical protein
MPGGQTGAHALPPTRGLCRRGRNAPTRRLQREQPAAVARSARVRKRAGGPWLDESTQCRRNSRPSDRERRAGGALRLRSRPPIAARPAGTGAPGNRNRGTDPGARTPKPMADIDRNPPRYSLHQAEGLRGAPPQIRFRRLSRRVSPSDRPARPRRGDHFRTLGTRIETAGPAPGRSMAHPIPPRRLGNSRLPTARTPIVP